MYFKLDKSKKMKRVYLAKSNRANPNLVSVVRQTLSKFNVQIVEFTGGYYTHDLLLSCDELYVIPDINEAYQDNNTNFWSVSIGKGLYEQIQAFHNKTSNNDIFIVTDFDDQLGVGGFYYEGNHDDIYSIDIENENDYVDYAYLTVNTENATINPWELYDFVLESNDIKDESWVSNALNESIAEHKTWKGNNYKKKFLFIVAKKLAKLKLS